MVMPSSGSGGPSVLKVGSGALPAITTGSTVPPEMCLSTQSRTSVAANIGHMRLSTATGMRVPAKSKAKWGTAPE